MGLDGGQQGGSRWSAAAASSLSLSSLLSSAAVAAVATAAVAAVAAVAAAYLSDHCSRKDSGETGADGCARRSYIL